MDENIELNTEWEDQKENIKPLRRGRNVGLLTQTLASDAQLLQEQQSAFEEALQRQSDTLPIWEKYIHWMQHYKFGDTGELILLLERCTKELTQLNTYHNDIRFLKIWLTYVDLCEDPLDLFSFMNSNKIGSQHALFYERWAAVLEDRGNYTMCDQVYLQGIKQAAQPLEQLKTQYQRFQLRFAQRLKETVTTKPETVNRPSLRPANSTSKTRQSSSVSSSLAASKTKTGQKGVPASSQVFVDRRDGPEKENSVALGEAQGWKQLAPERERQKENKAIPSQWTSIAVPQKGSKKNDRQATASFVIYED